MRRLFIPCAVLASGLALAGCGGDGSSPPAPSPTGTETPATTQVTTTDTVPTPPAASKPETITIVVKGGRPQGGIQRPTVDKGDRVVLVVRTDAGEQVHLHGYDVERPVTPGTPLRIPLTASIPGRFELELHHPDALLAVIEVRP